MYFFYIHKMPNNKSHLTYKVLLMVQRQNGEAFMPNGYAYQYILPSRVQPANSIMHKANIDSMKDGKGPAAFLYTGR
jgi:hypothetical protein